MKAKRRLGQNFLVDRHYQERIIKAVSPQRHETIIEIGPGRGALTEHLAESNARLLAIELDRELIPDLTANFSVYPNVRIIEADALTVDYTQLISPATSARVVANLPYYISTPLVQKLIDCRQTISEMTLMLQREVVDRLSAQPGGKDYGYLSVIVQLACEVSRLFDVPPGAFRPAPQVYSSVVRLRRRTQPLAPVNDEALFTVLSQVLFAQRRKTIQNNLRAGWARLGLSDAGQIDTALLDVQLDPRRRAETLAIEELAALSERIRNLEKRPLV